MIDTWVSLLVRGLIAAAAFGLVFLAAWLRHRGERDERQNAVV